MSVRSVSPLSKDIAVVIHASEKGDLIMEQMATQGKKCFYASFSGSRGFLVFCTTCRNHGLRDEKHKRPVYFARSADATRMANILNAQQ